MISTSFLNRVGGTLSLRSCEVIASVASSVPDDGVILDLNCGEGRSTLSMALALDSVGADSVSILAVDTHIINPLSQTPHEDGTVLKLLKNLRVYQALHRVVPMVMPISGVTKVLYKKCANAVVFQAPIADLTVVTQGLETAAFALRAKGSIVVCLPNPAKNIWDSLRLVLPEHTYTLTHDSPELRVYTKKGA